MTTLLVTGAAGFIGSHFTRMMMREQAFDKVVAFDSLTYAGRPEALDVQGVKVEIGNILDKRKVLSLFRRNAFTHVVHMAAETHVDRSIFGAEKFAQTNVIGTTNLLSALNSSLTKFVYVSTDEVYGTKLTGLSVETDVLHPSSPYSASKAGGEMMCLAFKTTHGLPVVITRGTNTFGPWQNKEKLIPMIVDKVMHQQPVPVYGDGLQMRDWISVEDHCRAIWRALEVGSPGEAYNVGARNVMTNLTLISLVMNIIHGKGGPLGEMTHVADRLGHDRRYAVDPSKMERLGWSPHVFDMAPTVQSYMS